MGETEDDAAEAAERLQAVLERIAALARPSGGEPAMGELAAGLDAIIAQLRAALRGAPETKTSR